MRIVNCTNRNYIKKIKLILDSRRNKDISKSKVVEKILEDIKKNKKKALIKYEKKYSKNTEIIISKKKINKAISSLSPKIKKSIDFAYKRIFNFHHKQKIKNIQYKDKFNNKLEYKYLPLESVGIYVPANLPSTLLMNAIPAKIARVKRIVLANPKLNGKLNPAVLYVAKKIGIKEIYSMGGAQAIGSLTYIQKVNKIIGPGNTFVTEAKKKVFGEVGIEGMIAGPSEITVLADKNTNVDEIATSLIGQAEHDINSQCILITKDKNIIKKTQESIKKNLPFLNRNRIIKQSLKKNGLLILAKSDKQIINIINEIAPEHLELNIKNSNKILNKIKNAGSICIGSYSAMAVTDYNVGTNHVLPTFGSAKFSSGLNLNDFYKKISHIKLSKKGIEVIGKQAITLAEYEELFGHALSIKSRIRRN